ncbi:MAG TPA: DUF1598 domain-containing protein [Bacteroidales bacterium]|nr:DUF1598 domain-containing protein [Bacteroidales bacterium]
MKILLLTGLVFLLFPGCRHRISPEAPLYMKGEHICISLAGIMQTKTDKILNNDTALSEIDTMYGMSWLEGYVIDKENNDIILLGRSIPGRPAYNISDLFVNFQNVMDSVIAPYCSLDPYPENIKKVENILNAPSYNYEKTKSDLENAVGGQKVVVRGVGMNTNHAEVMIYADYEMKKISQGKIKVKGIPSLIDLSIADSCNRSLPSSTMSRFWFHIKENNKCSYYPNFTESDGICIINECPVVVLTEKQQADADGNLSDNEFEEDPIAEAFAEIMSLKYVELSNEIFWFAELENLYRLQACFRAMEFKGAFQESGFDLNLRTKLYVNTKRRLPEALPGLVNYHLTQRVRQNGYTTTTLQNSYLVCGGVDMSVNVASSNLFSKSGKLNYCKEFVLGLRPVDNIIIWRVNMSSPPPPPKKIKKDRRKTSLLIFPFKVNDYSMQSEAA